MISVIIAAAGLGKRMGGSVKKQYRKVGNLPVLVKTVKAFCAFREQFEIVVAAPAEDVEFVAEMLQDHFQSTQAEMCFSDTLPLGWEPNSGSSALSSPDGSPIAVNRYPRLSSKHTSAFAALKIDDVSEKHISVCEPSFPSAQLKVVPGGATRAESVQNALAVCTGDLVLVHDAARCFIDEATIERVTDALKSGADAVIPCVAPKSTIRTEGETLDRSKLYEVQTPQGFKRKVLEKAFAKAKEDGFAGTDEGSYTDHIGVKATIVEGNYKNIKITTEEDMPKETRVGFGYDVHRLVEGRKLMLGCIEVPCEKGLLGHSDADVLAHAIADALLGACALRDIGYYFPDNADETEGMSGKTLLEKVLKLTRDAGFTIINIDSTIVAQKPKLSPHIEDMRKAVAEVLNLDINQVGIKAKTEEGLGITGTGEAMAAHAVASVK